MSSFPFSIVVLPAPRTRIRDQRQELIRKRETETGKIPVFPQKLGTHGSLWGVQSVVCQITEELRMKISILLLSILSLAAIPKRQEGLKSPKVGEAIEVTPWGLSPSGDSGKGVRCEGSLVLC